MNALLKSNRVIIFLSFLFLLYATVAVYHLTQKSMMPRQYISSYPVIVDGNLVRNNEESEFLANLKAPDSRVTIENPALDLTVTTQLMPYYESHFILFDAFIILLIFVIGAFVLIKRPNEESSRVFYFTSITVSAAIIGTKTLHAMQPEWLGNILCVLFFTVYTIVSVTFLHFTFLFPTLRWKHITRIIPWLYIAGISIALSHAWLYLKAVRSLSLEMYRNATSLSMLQNGFILILLFIGVLNFIYSYRNAGSLTEKKKIRWILFGLSVGPTPFIFFWTLPIAFGTSPWIPEIGFKIFILLIPLTFAIAILKYHAMDIDLIINRSTVYGIVIGAGLTAYLGIVGLTAHLITQFTAQISLIVSTITATVLAFLFEPARRHVQRFVDRSFFRVQYDFRHAQHRFIEEIKQCISIQSVAEQLVARIDEFLPSERIGFFRLQSNKRMLLLAHHNLDFLKGHGIPLNATIPGTPSDLPIALSDAIDAGIPHEIADKEKFRRWSIVLVFPIISEQREVLGCVILGQKKSGLRFTGEDIDLLNTFITQAGLTIERIELQQKLLLEQAETQRLDELNKLKSYFVSSVSHDLKTPLTSIKMFAELLRTGKNISKASTNEYLEIIEGESERLTRLINNVLDFSRIERGVKEYHFSEIELNTLIRHILKTMHYQFKIENCTVHTHLCERDCYLNVDKDAVTEAFVNLISNALKYSNDKKEIFIMTFRKDGSVIVEVTDKGVGISQENIEQIFEPFYRGKEGKTLGTGGAGLGLAIVKHIMDAHKGKIEVQSVPGEGSTFKLFFPLSIEA